MLRLLLRISSIIAFLLLVGRGYSASPEIGSLLAPTSGRLPLATAAQAEGQPAALGDVFLKERVKKIGIELETASLKVLAPGDDHLELTVALPSGKIWKITDDTTDHFLKKTSLSGFNRNLECMTVGGFENQEEFLHVIRDMKNVLNHLYTIPSQVKVNLLNPLVRSNLPITITKGPKEFWIVRARDTKYVQPQITYQLPLEHIFFVFNRSKDYFPPISAFLDALRPNLAHRELLNNKILENKIKLISLKNKKEAEKKELKQLKKDYDVANKKRKGIKTNAVLAEKNFEAQKVRYNNVCKDLIPFYVFEIQLFFQDNLALIIHGMENKRLQGFCYLFLWYWQQLFNNGEDLPRIFPGPKGFLKIMSRTPFSQLYKFLPDDEQTAFKKTFDDIIGNYGGNYNLRHYVDDESRTVPLDSNFNAIGRNTLNLKQWYYSIIDPEDKARRVINPDDARMIPPAESQYKPKEFVDRLSPPPVLEEYPMGALSIEGPGIALLEMRMFPGGRETFDTIEEFVNKELSWFFNPANFGNGQPSLLGASAVALAVGGASAGSPAMASVTGSTASSPITTVSASFDNFIQKLNSLDNAETINDLYVTTLGNLEIDLKLEKGLLPEGIINIFAQARDLRQGFIPKLIPYRQNEKRMRDEFLRLFPTADRMLQDLNRVGDEQSFKTWREQVEGYARANPSFSVEMVGKAAENRRDFMGYSNAYTMTLEGIRESLSTLSPSLSSSSQSSVKSSERKSTPISMSGSTTDLASATSSSTSGSTQALTISELEVQFQQVIKQQKTTNRGLSEYFSEEYIKILNSLSVEKRKDFVDKIVAALELKYSSQDVLLESLRKMITHVIKPDGIDAYKRNIKKVQEKISQLILTETTS